VNATIIIQARMTSTRLPGKVLLPVLGRPMLSYQIERLRRVRSCGPIVVATTTNDTDDVITKFCAGELITCTRGSESDVLSRYYEAAVLTDSQTVVRVTSDCPLIDPGVVERVIATFFEQPGACDYASNMIEPTFPYGMAVEVMSFAALREAHEEARDPAEREHVTPFIYWRPERYRLRSVTMNPSQAHLRWTVDTPEDFLLVSRILETLYPVKPKFEMSDVLSLLKSNPDLQDINAHVRQKNVSPQQKVR